MYQFLHFSFTNLSYVEIILIPAHFSITNLTYVANVQIPMVVKRCTNSYIKWIWNQHPYFLHNNIHDWLHPNPNIGVSIGSTSTVGKLLVSAFKLYIIHDNQT